MDNELKNQMKLTSFSYFSNQNIRIIVDSGNSSSKFSIAKCIPLFFFTLIEQSLFTHSTKGYFIFTNCCRYELTFINFQHFQTTINANFLHSVNSNLRVVEYYCKFLTVKGNKVIFSQK